jgi:hypothetical protein
MNFQEQLEEIKRDCSFPDWDGYGALPLNETSVRLAKQFIKQVMELYPELPYPELCPEPDGDLGFDWNVNENKLAVSINSNYLVSYCVVFSNGTRGKGDYPYKQNEINPMIESHIEEILKKEKHDD